MLEHLFWRGGIKTLIIKNPTSKKDGSRQNKRDIKRVCLS